MKRAAAPKREVGDVRIHQLTPSRWGDLEELFGPNGASAGCWCMWWRVSGAEFRHSSGEKNRRDFKSLVDHRRPTGVLAYVDGRAVGWCSVSPKRDFGRIVRSVSLRSGDADGDTWSVVCFFIARGARRRGVGKALLRKAVDYAAARGATAVEGYPVDAADGLEPGAAYTGVTSMFRAAGFRTAKRTRGARRSVMRLDVRPAGSKERTRTPRTRRGGT
jgi:GNAT superfamily N-acetyltransferase